MFERDLVAAVVRSRLHRPVAPHRPIEGGPLEQGSTAECGFLHVNRAYPGYNYIDLSLSAPVMSNVDLRVGVNIWPTRTRRSS